MIKINNNNKTIEIKGNYNNVNDFLNELLENNMYISENFYINNSNDSFYNFYSSNTDWKEELQKVIKDLNNNKTIILKETNKYWSLRLQENYNINTLEGRIIASNCYFQVVDLRDNTQFIENEVKLRHDINNIELERIRINQWSSGLYGLNKHDLKNNNYNLDKLLSMYKKEDYKIISIL